MKKILTVSILLFASVLTYACTDKAQAQQKEPEKKEAKSGEVIVNPRIGNIKVINLPSLTCMPTGVVPVV